MKTNATTCKIVWGCFGQALLVGAGLGVAGYAQNAGGLFGEYMGSTAGFASLMAGVGALLLLVVKDHRSPALAYAWVLAYGLGGGAANKLGNALVAWGAILVSGAYALTKRHVVACCYVVPPLGFCGRRLPGRAGVLRPRRDPRRVLRRAARVGLRVLSTDIVDHLTAPGQGF